MIRDSSGLLNHLFELKCFIVVSLYPTLRLSNRKWNPQLRLFLCFQSQVSQLIFHKHWIVQLLSLKAYTIQLTINGFDLGLEISTVIVSKSSVSNSVLEIAADNFMNIRVNNASLLMQFVYFFKYEHMITIWLICSLLDIHSFRNLYKLCGFILHRNSKVVQIYFI